MLVYLIFTCKVVLRNTLEIFNSSRSIKMFKKKGNKAYYFKKLCNILWQNLGFITKHFRFCAEKGNFAKLYKI